MSNSIFIFDEYICIYVLYISYEYYCRAFFIGHSIMRYQFLVPNTNVGTAIKFDANFLNEVICYSIITPRFPVHVSPDRHWQVQVCSLFQILCSQERSQVRRGDGIFAPPLFLALKIEFWNRKLFHRFLQNFQLFSKYLIPHLRALIARVYIVIVCSWYLVRDNLSPPICRRTLIAGTIALQPIRLQPIR